MTYLTQALIDAGTASRLKLWAWDCYKWHKAVWEAFPGRRDKQREFLTRLDEKNGSYRLLIVSSEIPVRPNWCPPDGWQTKPIPEQYFQKSRYAFQLRANPTKKVAVQNPDGSFKKNSRREPLRTRDELVAWIQRKAEQGGFAVDVEKLRIIQHGPQRFKKDGAAGTHTAVEFQGVLTVTDPKKFHETFTRGIGPAKAFGFGLLVIAPIT
ncbi:MAG: type I-E CRISPR-associated protein Cas6/Cse3/CasE [Verrucomicrobiae bacterium]|nr:type I-E CRISPR-associated protein Cas6/Cse3/CasE [Verrucomicrobiae bacterium]